MESRPSTDLPQLRLNITAKTAMLFYLAIILKLNYGTVVLQ
jgi:hypothetical protein